MVLACSTRFGWSRRKIEARSTDITRLSLLQAVTIRDTDNNMQWNEAEGLLTYRARKIYSFVPELSADGYKDPDKIFVTGKSSEKESQLLLLSECISAESV